jgi:hypothetical protein
MDISVTEGVCVGLIVDKHPMGNTNRWFVDDGGMYDILGNYGKFSLYFHTVVPPLINPLSPNSTPLINPLSPMSTPLINPLSPKSTPLIYPLSPKSTPLINPLSP